MEEKLGLEEGAMEAARAVEVEGGGEELLSESEEVYWEVEVGNMVFLLV